MATFPKNLNLCFNRPHSSPATTTSGGATTSASFFNSLYEPNSLSDDDVAPPDFSTLYASHRFFFPSPGRSNSIVDSSSEPEPLPMEAVQTYSPDPYADFRRSMEEMVEARGIHEVRGNWKSLHELLLWYLSLNPKPTHKFIVAAFSDLLVSLLASLTPAGVVGVRGCSFGN